MRKLTATCFICALTLPAAYADNVILDDQIVQGSACFGLDCIEGENFGFETMRLSENNLRIRFRDTSNSAAFPTTDWQITLNDSNNGGLSYFAVEDLDAGTMPFRVVGGAPSTSFHIGPLGHVGLGTSAPAQNLHIRAANQPGIRLEQGGGAFDPQHWDIVANESQLTISVGGTEVFVLESNGDVTIPGTLTAGTPPDEFPDYVFSPSYALMPLDDLQSYISTNNRLPGIPSAAEVGANGVNMTELQVSLLKKVEELTLYTLQQQSRIGELERRLAEMGGAQ